MEASRLSGHADIASQRARALPEVHVLCDSKAAWQLHELGNTASTRIYEFGL